MEIIIVKCGDFAFAVNLREVFKIVLKNDVRLNNENVHYKDYTFYNMTEKFKDLIKKDYPDDYYVLFANPESQAALSVEKVEGALEIGTTDLYPLQEDIFVRGTCLFKYFYYNTKKKKGVLLFDFQQLV